jgi:hypothetical protein
MARPVVSDTAERLYARLGPIVAEDEDYGWAFLHLVEAATRPLDEVEGLARDTEDGPGWSSLMDPDTAPEWALGWLAQFVGVSLLGNLDVASQRLRISETGGFNRGKPSAIIAAAQQFLTGTKKVDLYERDGSAYRLRLRTYAGETPADTTQLHAAIMAQKPAGLVLVLEVQEGLTIDQLTGTIDGLAGTIDSYSDVVPG